MLLLLSLFAAAQDAPDLSKPFRSGVRAPADAAVVVGIERYPFASDVPHAQRDARAMHAFLLHGRGIPDHRIEVLDQGASREQILEAAQRAGERVGSDGVVWFYFAGHGAADPSTGERLLLGDDVRRDTGSLGSRGVAVSEIRAVATAGGGSVNLLVDACYAGVGRDGQELLAGRRFLVPTAAIKPDFSGIEWNAAGPDQLSAPLDAVEHGAFTYFAIGAMRGWADGFLDGQRDGVVTADEARAYVNHALRSVGITDQHSQIVATDPSRVELVRSERLEMPPEQTVLDRLREPGAALPTSRPQATGPGLDPSDRRGIIQVLQPKVDDCYLRHGVGTVGLRQWAASFRAHPTKGLRGVRVWPTAKLGSGFYAARRDALRRCIAEEVRGLQVATPQRPVRWRGDFRVTVTAEPTADQLVPDRFFGF